MLRQIRLAAVTLLILLGTGTCTGGGEYGFRDSRPEFMQELKAALPESTIPFRQDAEGFIRYQSKYEEAVNRIRDRVEKEISGGVALKFADKESRDYLKSLLTSMEMK